MTRRVFYSFHYEPDNWRASQVRNIGAIEGNEPASDNDWETIVGGGDARIEKWISEQMSGRTCTVVLVGEKTARRKWINYEIKKSWNNGMGVVGIRIHGLKDKDGDISNQGANPFDITVAGRNLKYIVDCHDPAGENSKQRYNWIQKYIACIIEEAIENRKKY